MDEKLKSKITKLEHSVDKENNTVLVSAELSARYGKEKPVVLTVQAVRDWLVSENNIEVKEHLSGTQIHNNMSRRLGNRSIEDLRQNYVFRLPPVETKVKAKPAPKPKVKAVPKTETKVIEKEQPKAEPTLTQRSKAITTASTTTKTTKPKTTRSRRNNSTKKLTKTSE